MVDSCCGRALAEVSADGAVASRMVARPDITSHLALSRVPLCPRLPTEAADGLAGGMRIAVRSRYTNIHGGYEDGRGMLWAVVGWH